MTDGMPNDMIDDSFTGRWQFWIDRGGTFTDVVARQPDGALKTLKLLSENPGRYDDAAIAAIRQLLGLAESDSLPPLRVAAIKMGTTVATNALLTRAGEPTLLATTRGFADALAIGYQNRPKLFARQIEKAAPLYKDVVEIDERIAADGAVVTPLDVAQAEAALRRAYESGLRAVAIALMHAWRNPAHELALGALAKKIGFTQITLSHEVDPAIKLVLRAETTVADAYLTPVVKRYVAQVAAPAADIPLFFMQSNGGLVDAASFRGRDAVLSGPAGGIVGATAAAKRAGLSPVVTFDMGGTSTDVAWWDGSFERADQSTHAGVRVRAPMLAIHTVAAGGGSILKLDNGRLRAGPESAGADPGPASYRRGGPLTVTDANVVLGRIQPDFFPHVFGPSGDQPLDPVPAARAFEALAARMHLESGGADTAGAKRALSPPDIAEGFLAVAVENMAHAIKHVSIARGHDVTKAALVAFGGAGGQHACKVAEALGVERVLIHPLAGMLSAFGIGQADLLAVAAKPVERALDDALIAELRAALDALQSQARASLAQSPVRPARVRLTEIVKVRIDGSDTALPIPFGTASDVRAAFIALHKKTFGFEPASTRLIVESVRLEAAGEMATPALAAPVTGGKPAAPLAQVPLFVDRHYRDVPAYRRGELAAGQRIAGPALVIEDGATTVIDAGWSGVLSDQGDLLLEREKVGLSTSSFVTPAKAGVQGPLDSRLRGNDDKQNIVASIPEAPSVALDPIKLEIFDSLFMAMAEEMGVVLANTAHSVNIKERLDFSCAIFDSEARLVANAPHMPVHLGSMDETVMAVVRAHSDKNGRPTFAAGDAFVHNAPYNGGTHLPDVTVVLPVFHDGSDKPIAYVAARGHHADIGGISPGSMPPFSHTIDEEGVLFDALPLVGAGQFLEKEIRAHLTGKTSSSARPSARGARNPDQNLRDLKAQVAACSKGAADLARAANAYGLNTLTAYMGFVQDNAERFVRAAIGALKDGAFTCEMDDGSRISVAVTVDRAQGSAIVDFAGTSAQHAGNLNAPRAVTRAAVLYVFRTLVDADIPMNAGCLRPIDIRIPPGSMLAPAHPAAVCAGNVETSQVVVDALFGALGVMAAAQGTMNNLTFGDATRQYYETICGGSGAGTDSHGNGFAGASAVHTHMTNSRLTDPEVLEARYPVRVEEFSVRKNSGGQGAWRGGDGAIRKIKFLAPVTAAILSDRRRVAPFGLDGGGAGAVGRNTVVRASGAVERLAGTAETRMAAGDAIVIETPGGGGVGGGVGGKPAQNRAK